MTDNLTSITVKQNNLPIYNIEYRTSFDDLINYFKYYSPDKNRKCCIVSDSKVASYYLDAIFHIADKNFQTVVSFVFPEGEESKNLNTIHDIYVKLIENNFDRNDLMIALGGGVTGDMCGFASATFLRGINFIQIPTSLLADVDSSIGGKTGVDFDSYKNMVGAFHMPSLVYINIKTLKTLDRRQWNSGMGEVVKSALIKDKDFFEFLEKNKFKIKSMDESIIKNMIYKCNIIKKNVVEYDPKETKGERAKLNFGHTLGHAIEKYMNFKFLHGECVSIGCMLATIISYKRNMISNDDLQRITSFFISNMEIPKLPDDIDIVKIIDITKNDKKSECGRVKFILLNGIGNAVVDSTVTHDDMYSAFNIYMNKYNKKEISNG